MATVYKCDRCGKEIDVNDKENKIHRIKYKISVTPEIEEVKDIIKDNLDGLDFCKECATKIVKILHEPISKPENLGI